MTQTEIYTRLNSLFCELFLCDEIALVPTTTAVDIDGWDSFRHIELMLTIEEHFGIRFHSRELDAMRNIGDLVGLIEARLPLD